MHISIIFFSFGDFHDFNVYYYPVFSKLDDECEHDHELVKYNCILYHCKIIHYGDFGWGSAESNVCRFLCGGHWFCWNREMVIFALAKLLCATSPTKKK